MIFCKTLDLILILNWQILIEVILMFEIIIVDTITEYILLEIISLFIS